MPKIYATVGLPGSGKSTFAADRCSDGTGRTATRDDIRFEMYGVYFGPPIDERKVTLRQDELVGEILDAGLDVWIDDTNLSAKAKQHCIDLARMCDVELEWVDFTDVPLEECIRRDALRERVVGADVIQSMHDRYLR